MASTSHFHKDKTTHLKDSVLGSIISILPICAEIYDLSNKTINFPINDKNIYLKDSVPSSIIATLSVYYMQWPEVERPGTAALKRNRNDIAERTR